MSGSQYRRNVTLADLLAGQGSATPVAPAAPQANYVGSDQGGIPPAERNRLLEILMQPDDVGPPPEIDEGTLSTNIGANIFAGIGDALGAYGAVLGGGRAPNYMQQLQDKKALDKARKQQYGQRKAGAETDAKRRTAEYLIGQDDAKLQRQQELADKKALRQQTVENAQTKRALELEDEAIKRKFILDKEGRDQDWDLKIQKANFAHAEAMEREQNKARNGDKEAEKVLAGFSLGSRIVGGFRRGLGADPKTGAPPVPPLVERLKKGENADAIRREFESEMNEEGIFGKARDLSRDLFNEQLLRAAREVQKQAEQPPAEDSLYGPFTGGVNAWDEAIKGALPPPRP